MALVSLSSVRVCVFFFTATRSWSLMASVERMPMICIVSPTFCLTKSPAMCLPWCTPAWETRLFRSRWVLCTNGIESDDVTLVLKLRLSTTTVTVSQWPVCTLKNPRSQRGHDCTRINEKPPVEVQLSSSLYYISSMEVTLSTGRKP